MVTTKCSSAMTMVRVLAFSPMLIPAIRPLIKNGYHWFLCSGIILLARKTTISAVHQVDDRNAAAAIAKWGGGFFFFFGIGPNGPDIPGLLAPPARILAGGYSNDSARLRKATRPNFGRGIDQHLDHDRLIRGETRSSACAAFLDSSRNGASHHRSRWQCNCRQKGSLNYWPQFPRLSSRVKGINSPHRQPFTNGTQSGTGEMQQNRIRHTAATRCFFSRSFWRVDRGKGSGSNGHRPVDFSPLGKLLRQSLEL